MSGPSCRRCCCLFWFPGLLLHTVTLLSSEFRSSAGMQVTSTGPQTLQKAKGESVTLGCSYEPSPYDTGELDIEWSVVSPDTTQKDEMLISFTGGNKYIHGNHNTLSFAAADPSQGDASLFIAALSPAYSATYQCKVKKSPGVDTRKMTLVVLVKPSVPKCWAEGGQLVGHAAALHCHSATGSAPLKYQWRREGGGAIPATATQNSLTGELKISNHSQSLAGIYVCEANNAVGAEHCRINLRANTPPNRAAVIVGTVVGSLLLIIILLVFIGLLFWKLRHRFDYEKDFSNDIREDAPPPESRPVSRHTSRSASRHPQVAYSQVGETRPDVGHRRPLSTSSGGFSPQKSTAVEYDSKYGHAV
ncbi:V-set and immunoglobulin domain-containing protein 8a [Solea solea]|uniref:V-set and immunoglobulin domain-containing protein 8a n=1 Tax=Solea solea TaxID=90069 RepID=UPI00272BF756|nr:V-set and immunoglobulin domain-containing protein 8a [Solea solea]